METLSDKIWGTTESEILPVEDVKQFIKDLKKTLEKYMMGLDVSVLNREIDELAGDKLI